MKSHFRMQERPLSLNLAMAIRANELAKAKAKAKAETAEKVKPRRPLTEAARLAIAVRMASEAPTGPSTAAYLS